MVIDRLRAAGRPVDEAWLRRRLDGFTKKIESSPRNAALWGARGRVYLALNQPDQALPDISKAIELAPHDGATAWRYLDRATAYRGLQQVEPARAELSRAIEHSPNLWDAWLWRANFHRDLREWNAAVADFTKALELNPTYTPGWQARGFCYVNLADWGAALADYAKSTQLEPQNAAAHNDLAWLLATCPDGNYRDPSRAVESARKAIELSPAAGHLWNTLGVAQYRAGNLQAAVEALAKSNELHKGGQLAFNGFFQAMALWRLDQPNEARQWFDKAVAWMDANAKDNAELLRFRAEAAALLGITEPTDEPVSALRPGNK
jgi:tetratricopeptide (TPR) repeat protein